MFLPIVHGAAACILFYQNNMVLCCREEIHFSSLSVRETIGNAAFAHILLLLEGKIPAGQAEGVQGDVSDGPANQFHQLCC